MVAEHFSTGLWCSVNVAFSQVGDRTCGGHEVFVVVEYREAMVRSSSADQQIHCR